MLKLSSKESSTSGSSFNRSLDYIDLAKETQTHLYGHKINIDNLINICTAKLSLNPSHKKAIFIRATSFMKKKMLLQSDRRTRQEVAVLSVF